MAVRTLVWLHCEVCVGVSWSQVFKGLDTKLRNFLCKPMGKPLRGLTEPSVGRPWVGASPAWSSALPLLGEYGSIAYFSGSPFPPVCKGESSSLFRPSNTTEDQGTNQSVNEGPSSVPEIRPVSPSDLIPLAV